MTTAKEFKKFLSNPIEFDLTMQMIHTYCEHDDEYDNLSYDDKIIVITCIASAVVANAPDTISIELYEFLSAELEKFTKELDYDDNED